MQPRVTRRAGVSALPLLLSLGAIARSPAQTLRGELVGATTGLPVAFGLISLLDSARLERDRTVTAVDGRFVLRAPGPGEYRLRALRIGYRRWDSPPLRLSAGETLDYRIEMPEVPVQLASITVERRNRCRVRPAEGESAATLWEEVTKALRVTQVTLERKLYRFRTETFRRTLDRALKPLEEQRDSALGFGGWSFVSLPPESLARRGFVYDSTGGPVFVAPDIQVLLSDPFLESHCFKVQSPAGNDTALVGLAFEPVPRPQRRDIAGVLWLDRRTAELRVVEYHYTNLDPWMPGARAGGRVEFHQLPDGAWFIRGWSITVPILRIRAGASRADLSGFRQGGGQVREVLTAGGRPILTFP